MEDEAIDQRDERAPDETLTLISARIPGRLRRRLRVHCAQRDLSAAQFLRMAIEQALAVDAKR